jgi:hypothetical protein
MFSAGDTSDTAMSIALKRFMQRSAKDIKAQEMQSSLTILLKVEP